MAVLKPLKTAHPQARLSFLTSPVGQELLKNNPYLSEIFAFQKKAGLSLDRIAWIRKLRQKKFDLIINLKSGSFFPYFLGFQKKWNILPKDKKLRSKRTTHAIDIYLNVIRQQGVAALKKDLDMRVYPADQERQTLKDLLAREGHDFKKQILVFAPFSNWHAKEWGIERFLKLSDQLKRQFNTQNIFVGGREDCQKIGHTPFPSPFINFVGKLTLRQLAALYEQTRLAIGGDSGPFHLAVNQGTPALALFGATSHQRARPYFSPDHYMSCEKNLGCNPCIPGPHYMACRVYDRTTPCMEALSFESVYKKAQHLLSARS